MPAPAEIDRKLAAVLESMNIPKSKQTDILAESYEKKWQLVVRQVPHVSVTWSVSRNAIQTRVQSRHPPSHYLLALQQHIEAIDKALKKVPHQQHVFQWHV